MMADTIYYTLFSENEVFEDHRLNVFFNQLFTFLINNLGEEFVSSKLAIDKHVALLLQDEPVTVKIPGIFLVTAEESIFRLIRSSATTLAISNQRALDRQVILMANDTRVYFGLVEKLPLTIDNDGITLVDKTKIVL